MTQHVMFIEPGELRIIDGPLDMVHLYIDGVHMGILPQQKRKLVEVRGGGKQGTELKSKDPLSYTVEETAEQYAIRRPVRTG